MKKSSITSLMSAFGRAYHAENADAPIFDDKKARELMTDEEYSMIANYILGGIDFFAPDKKDSFADNKEALRYLVNTQIAPTPLARAAFCETALKTSMRTGTEIEVIGKECSKVAGSNIETTTDLTPILASSQLLFSIRSEICVFLR